MRLYSSHTLGFEADPLYPGCLSAPCGLGITKNNRKACQNTWAPNNSNETKTISIYSTFTPHLKRLEKRSQESKEEAVDLDLLMELTQQRI